MVSRRRPSSLWKAHLCPTTSPVLPTILVAIHDVGHEGVQKILQSLHTDFHVTHAHQEVKAFIRNCAVCQRNKTEHLHPASLLQPLEVPIQVWANIATDFVEGLPLVGGKSVIFTVIDRFSKYAYFIPLAHPYIAVTACQAFFNEIVRLHGLPSSNGNDRDVVFTSSFWQELFKLARV